MENKKNIRCFFKKIAEILGIVYITAMSGFSVACIVFACFGYNFSLCNYEIFAVGITLLAIAEVVMVFVAGRKSFGKMFSVLFLINAFLMCVNIAVWVFKSESPIVAGCLLINVPCTLTLGIVTARSRAFKLACSIGAGVPIVIAFYFSLIFIVFGDFGENTVVKTLNSPDGTYYAQVVDSDQGALGGDTTVNVYKNKEIHTPVFSLTPIPDRVYMGEWRAWENMNIYWEDDSCLVINSREYYID